MPKAKPTRDDATFFATPADFRAWLEQHHDAETELLVGYWKRHTGEPSITWPESVDQALCFGWIDGIRRRIDDEAYCIRFTPRQKRSNWSDVNRARFKELREQGEIHDAGLAAWKNRVPTAQRPASYELAKRGRDPELRAEYADRFAEHPEAWRFFREETPPSYRRRAIHWVESAKKEETRLRRLEQLIESSQNGERSF